MPGTLPLWYRLRVWRVFLLTWLTGHAVVALLARYQPGIEQDVPAHLLLAMLPGSLLAPSAVWWYRRRRRRRGRLPGRLPGRLRGRPPGRPPGRPRG